MYHNILNPIISYCIVRNSVLFCVRVPGQYSETCDGSSSSVTINTTNIPLGAEVMEVMVYRKRERRKYSPLTTDNTVFYVTGGDRNPKNLCNSLRRHLFSQTSSEEESESAGNLSPTISFRLPDKIPVAVSISQKAAVNQSDNVFFRGKDILFKVQLHDPSGYLKTASAVDYIWDFRDGNQLVTHRNITAHMYSTLGTMEVKLLVEAAFPIECPPTAATPTQMSATPAPPTGK